MKLLRNIRALRIRRRRRAEERKRRHREFMAMMEVACAFAVFASEYAKKKEAEK